MSRDSFVFGLAGVFFGVLIGWIIGSQQAAARVAPPPQTASAPSTPAAGQQAPPPFDQTRATALEQTAASHPRDAATRVQLANLYFDAERFPDATRWYEEALKIEPRDVDASTDLGIAYYYMNQPDRAIAQFDHSLQIDPKHTKTLFNLGIVRAFGKQDLQGAVDAWNEVLQVAPPGSDDARAAQQALDAVKSGHQNLGGNGARTPGN
ncbi:MAG TPA: tetratricopeptide repeat protein [Vicinamibacterales bacterium]|nr:tetratricopeptide repeat protein [Vicinamibacterales bacterium]